MTYTFNVQAFVQDAGGARSCAELVDVPRTAPYRWIRQGFVRSDLAAQIAKQLGLSLDHYLEASSG